MLLNFLYFSLFFYLILGDCGQNKDCNSCTEANLSSRYVCCWNSVEGICLKSPNFICPKNSTNLSYNCPIDPPKDFMYTDELGRHHVLPLLAAAYADVIDEAQICLDNQLTSAKVYGIYSMHNCSLGNCTGLLAYSSRDNAIIVSYRGAQGLDQVLYTGYDMLFDIKLPFIGGGNIFGVYHSGFFGLWLDLGLESAVLELKSRYPDADFWAVGQSLGGGFASVTAAYVSYKGLFPQEKIRMITTGQTRVGDLDYAKAHDGLVPYSYRIINRNDLVTKLPRKLYLDDSNVFHHRFEVWYPINMDPGAEFKVCKKAEDSTCSASTDDSFEPNHDTYFGLPSVGAWVLSGCTTPTSTIELNEESTIEVSTTSDSITKSTRNFTTRNETSKVWPASKSYLYPTVSSSTKKNLEMSYLLYLMFLCLPCKLYNK